MLKQSCVHFVGFRDGDSYLRAVMTWGPPDFIHMGWDIRAAREIADEDVVVFARGPHDQTPSEKSFSDTVECSRLPHLSDEAGRALAEQYGLASGAK